MQAALSLARRKHVLADPHEQVRMLSAPSVLPSFHETLAATGQAPLTAGAMTVLQVNVGKLCNQTCRHCHVDAGPDRREVMTKETMDDCLAVLSKSDVATVDITGGAPELNPGFRWFVSQVKSLGRHVMDRSNLTVMLVPGQEDLAEFLAENEVEVIASLPYYLARETDAQRGEGVFDRSIVALQKLNALGYGQPGGKLKLNLVYNPVGAYLPPAQGPLELDFKREMSRRYGISFNALYTITNMPISRYLEYLVTSGNYEGYLERLVNAFNPGSVAGLMCRYTLSVGWDGALYDCDFNQMLELPVAASAPRHIRDFDAAALTGRFIATARHCYGCTAGAGSSCGGAIT